MLCSLILWRGFFNPIVYEYANIWNKGFTFSYIFSLWNFAGLILKKIGYYIFREISVKLTINIYTFSINMLTRSSHTQYKINFIYIVNNMIRHISKNCILFTDIFNIIFFESYINYYWFNEIPPWKIITIKKRMNT